MKLLNVCNEVEDVRFMICFFFGLDGFVLSSNMYPKREPVRLLSMPVDYLFGVIFFLFC